MLVLSFSNYSWTERDVDRGRPTIKRNIPELANLSMEGYFRASYAPLGGSQIWREKASSTSMKPCFSMFRDKPPWVVRDFGGRKPPRHRRNSVSPCSEISPLVCPYVLAPLIILPEAAGAFSFFLASATSVLFLDFAVATFSSAFLLAFLFPPVPILSVFSFSLSSRSFSLTQF